MSGPAFVFHPDYEFDIGRHVFPTEKFRLFRDAVVEEGLATVDAIEYPEKATDEELLRVHRPRYLADLRSYSHTGRTLHSELPISRSIVEGCVRTAGGTLHAARRALECGAAFHLGGGFHHAFAGRAEGFCYINDVAIAAAWARRVARLDRVAVIDTDVHQGNGTAHIFRNDPGVFTFSIHQQRLYPDKQTSRLDIGLDAEIGDDGYCEALAPAVESIVRDFRPQLALVVAGVDPYEDDKLGRLGLSFAGMARRERLTFAPLAAAGIPFVTVTGGGYARRLEDTVALHVQTVRIALDVLASES
ncbi:MAG: hypothetical protein PWP23_2304 [Candidatus Sumerlaeota bacterium]|nr:hypothetical protein [Candidatus Sumerlaeota bacterium]